MYFIWTRSQVLVLVRVSVSATQEGDEALANNSRPLVSNVYSACELQLLWWLNKHYEDQRNQIWGTRNCFSLASHRCHFIV